MRIAYVCADRGIPLLGTKGASGHLRNLAAALVRIGHEVVLACARLEGPNAPPLGAEVVDLPADAGDAWYRELFRSRRIGAVLERYSLSTGPARPAAAGEGLVYALEVNAPLVEEAARFRGLTDADAWRVREREALSTADRIIAVSTEVARHAIACGAQPEHVAVVRNGVDLAQFGAGARDGTRRELGLDGRLVVGFVGSLKPWHGVARLIDAVRLLPAEYALLIVGEGPEFESLHHEAGGRAIFTGGVPQAEVPRYLAAMDIAVAPFEPLDNFYFSPLKLAEYLAAGLAVVASEQGDIPDVLADAGVLVPPGDTDALADAIRRLGDDAELRRRYGDAARERAAGMSWDSVARRVAEELSA